jgi:hypothetical protein
MLSFVCVFRSVFFCRWQSRKSLNIFQISRDATWARSLETLHTQALGIQTTVVLQIRFRLGLIIFHRRNARSTVNQVVKECGSYWYGSQRNHLSVSTSPLCISRDNWVLFRVQMRVTGYRHAGYSYSGPPAAHGFINIDPSKMYVFTFWKLALTPFRKRIFILGPSHHHYLSKCALSAMDVYETPLGNMKIDKKGDFYFQ